MLADPVRRALYLMVLGEGRPVGRDEAAVAVGVRRGLAAFHLDRLAEQGLLEVEYRRLSGRSGPGAGRPAKLYRAGEQDREVSLPPRSYALVGELLAEALEAARPGGSGEPAETVARRRGLEIGRTARSGLPPRAGLRLRGAALHGVLAELGYQPVDSNAGTTLRNCPFHALAETHRSLVCSMNHGLLAGVVEGLDLQRVEALLEPTEGACCVRLASVTARG